MFADLWCFVALRKKKTTKKQNVIGVKYTFTFHITITDQSVINYNIIKRW